MLWAGIVLPQLALDGVLRHHPAREIPLALIAGPAQQRAVLAVNTAAANLGVRPGMTVATAQALATALVLHAEDPAQPARLLQLLAAWAYRYSSLVSLEGEDALLVEVGASLGLFGPWPEFAARLRGELADAGFTHALGLAPTPRAALALAWGELSGKPAMPILHAEDLRAGLGALPLTASGFEPAWVTGLARMGLQTLGQALGLPRASLARRFGREAIIRIEQLLGERSEPREAYQPPDEFIARLDFNHEIHHTGPLIFPLRRMLGDLVLYLSRREYGVQRLELELTHATPPATRLMLGLRAPSRDASHLLELCRTRLEGLHLRGPVRGLGLMARELPRIASSTADLFNADSTTAMAWDVLSDRLRARLGDAALFQWQSLPDHRPERGMQAVPHLVREPAIRYTPPRPGWLLAEPRPWRGEVRAILSGPERIEAGWWEGEDVRRDYYVIETSRGQRAWVFRKAGETSGLWMLHGWFA